MEPTRTVPRSAATDDASRSPSLIAWADLSEATAAVSASIATRPHSPTTTAPSSRTSVPVSPAASRGSGLARQSTCTRGNAPAGAAHEGQRPQSALEV